MQKERRGEQNLAINLETFNPNTNLKLNDTYLEVEVR